VTLGLYKGTIRILDRQSPFSLYDTSIGGFTMGADYDQKDAAGFINILGLPIKLAAAKNTISGGRRLATQRKSGPRRRR
jgi:argininosuccinate synthase